MQQFLPAAREAIASGCLDTAPHAIVLYDLSGVREGIEELQRVFPADTMHAIALKACPLSELLKLTRDMGCGAEAATIAELEHAIRLGFPKERIVFDSPAKTVDELRFALDQGVHINVDNLQELDRVALLLQDREAGHVPSVGLRINPGLRSGTISATSTATRGSKFGVSLEDHKDAVISSFEAWPWLNGLHLHVGSQGCDLRLLTDAIARMWNLADAVDRRCGVGRISVLDIGGGLPARYRPEDPDLCFTHYAARLAAAVPPLFGGSRALITEFGRSVWANHAVAIARVEYTKISGGHRIAVIHLGADMFIRCAYVPEAWYHHLTVLDHSGHPKSSHEVTQDVVGPLCFSGDTIARHRSLPPIEPGDYVLIHDVGAYTLSMWSRYNSRCSPAVFGCSRGCSSLTSLRRAESVDQVLRFWT